nr:hypothetical protein [Bradyrhizobium brasilense]
MTDLDGEKAMGSEVVELENIADGCSPHGAAGQAFVCGKEDGSGFSPVNCLAILDPSGVRSPAEHFDQSGRARCISVALHVV